MLKLARKYASIYVRIYASGIQALARLHLLRNIVFLTADAALDLQLNIFTLWYLFIEGGTHCYQRDQIQPACTS